MLDSKDLETFRAMRQLIDDVKSKKRPLQFWIGAGASSWCGYPRWQELANQIHSDFVRHETSYDSKKGLELLGKSDYPELFQFCRDINSQRFYRLLSDNFTNREVTPVYHRFISALSAIEPVRVLTTNIDDLLERCLTEITQIGMNDLEQIKNLADSDKGYICKLHGSVSDLQPTIFTSDDYNKLLENPSYLVQLERLLANTSIIFLGYSLQDDYILSLIKRNHNLAKLFGDGPHFAILSDKPKSLPPNIRVIKYIPEPNKDHRSAISVIEEVRFHHKKNALSKSQFDIEKQKPQLRSAHLLSHIYPPGTWTSSQTVNMAKPGEDEVQMIIGTGFSNTELPDNRSTAMHDIIVGLLCFENIVAPIEAVGRVHTILGSDRFWRLVDDNILTFINWTNQEGIIFPNKNAISGGDIGSAEHFNPDKTKYEIGQLIRNRIVPAPGQEELASKKMLELERKTVEITREMEGSIPERVRSLLLRPSIRHILGMSGGTPSNSFTRWQMFPILRLAYVVKIGVACKILNIGSVKLDFGTSILTGPVFASTSGIEWSDDAASYIVCGKFSTDIGQLAIKNPSVIDAILSFRETQAAATLRQEILERLSAHSGADVNVAINNALNAGVSSKILQQARDTFVNLFVSDSNYKTHTPAIWNEQRFGEDAINLWRKRSQMILEEHCKKLHIDRYDPCPCGSGEKLKFCCEEALRTTVNSVY